MHLVSLQKTGVTEWYQSDVDCRNETLVRNGRKLSIHVPDHHIIFQNSFISALKSNLFLFSLLKTASF
jgi:hypothetical protein